MDEPMISMLPDGYCFGCGHEHEPASGDPRCGAEIPVDDPRNGPEHCDHMRYRDVLDLVAMKEAEARQQERKRLRLKADEYARRSAPPRDSAWTLHEAWEWVRDVFLADPEEPR